MSILELLASNIWGFVALTCLTPLAIFLVSRERPSGIGALVSDALSPVIHAYLCLRYPTYAADGSGRSIPTCPYRWPNGQGDVAKFLEGTKRSEQWRERYGGTYRLWSGMKPEIVISDPEDIRAVFKDSNNHAKATANNSGYLMQQLLGQCVGLINEGQWRAVRAIVERPFLASTVNSYIPLITLRTKAYFRVLKTQPENRLSRGLLDPVHDVKMLPFWIIADIIYGRLNLDAEKELASLIPLREALWQRMVSGGVSRFGWSRFLPGLANAELQEWKKRWALFNDKAADSALAQRQDGHGTAPIESMYEAVRQGSITYEQLLQTLDEMLFANLDVTMGGISWNIVFLATHPEIQMQLRKEIAAYPKQASEHPELPFETRESHVSVDPFSSYISSSSNLLSACILESARLRPLAAFSVPQSAPSPRTIGRHSTESGFVVPAGTSFIVDTFALNMKQPLWGAEPEVRLAYRPQRFLDLGRTEMRYRYWRYGFGPRQCMGKHVADLIIKLLLVHLLTNYELSLRDEDVGAEWERDKRNWIIHPVMELVCKSRG